MIHTTVRQKTCPDTKGFTVIEILVSVAIIGVLASIIVPSVTRARESARVAAAEAQVKEIHTAVRALGEDTHEWPGHQPADVVDSGGSNNEVWDLSLNEAGLVVTDALFLNWSGPYIPGMPLDPWGNNYFFDTDYDIGTSSPVWAAVVGSFGPNGAGQNVYDSDNIIYILSSE